MSCLQTASLFIYTGKPEYPKLFAALQQFFLIDFTAPDSTPCLPLIQALSTKEKPLMYLVAIAWMYVVLMMSVAEATAPNGTLLGAIITFFLYGVLPCVILMYLMGTPMRRRAIRAKEKAELEAFREAAARESASSSATTLSPSLYQPDAGSESPADAIAPVREKL
jgi:hypothetical protein